RLVLSSRLHGNSALTPCLRMMLATHSDRTGCTKGIPGVVPHPGIPPTRTSHGKPSFNLQVVFPWLLPFQYASRYETNTDPLSAVTGLQHPTTSCRNPRRLSDTNHPRNRRR